MLCDSPFEAPPKTSFVYGSYLTIVPSVFEGYGIVAAESLACQTPVVGSNTDGLREIIDNNALFESGNTASLIKVISRNLS